MYAPSDEQMLAYVRAHPDCTAREVAREVFGGDGRAKTPEYRAAHNRLGVLMGMGFLERDIRSAWGTAYTYRLSMEALEPEFETTQDPSLFPVYLSKRQLYLVIHVFQRGLDDGYLGDPTRQVMEHVKQEENRLQETSKRYRKTTPRSVQDDD